MNSKNSGKSVRRGEALHWFKMKSLGALIRYSTFILVGVCSLKGQKWGLVELICAKFGGMLTWFFLTTMLLAELIYDLNEASWTRFFAKFLDFKLKIYQIFGIFNRILEILWFSVKMGSCGTEKCWKAWFLWSGWGSVNRGSLPLDIPVTLFKVSTPGGQQKPYFELQFTTPDDTFSTLLDQPFTKWPPFLTMYPYDLLFWLFSTAWQFKFYLIQKKNAFSYLPWKFSASFIQIFTVP